MSEHLSTPERTPEPTAQPMRRSLGLQASIALNMLDMIGVGPFLTMPLVLAVAGSKLALVAWILAALIALNDGLVWAELGAAFPDAGGSFAFLREIYGRDKLGRLISFVYVWQLSFSAPMSIASGCLGFAGFFAWMVPALRHAPIAVLPWLHGTNLVAVGVVLLATVMLYRGLGAVARLVWIIFAGVMLAVIVVIAAGLRHAQLMGGWQLPHLEPQTGVWAALGQAVLLATYDYWGYYNITFLGAEVRSPGKTIPRAVLGSILIVAALYCGICLAVLPSAGVLVSGSDDHSRLAMLAEMVRGAFGPAAGILLALLIMWTAFGSVFSILLGYSRVPYAAAVGGNYFRGFAKLHPKYGFPHRALAALGLVSAVCCLFSFTQIVTTLVITRILLQFLFQQGGVILLRWKQPKRARPFRIPLYPLPPLIAMAGFIFILAARPHAMHDLGVAVGIGASGALIYLVRAMKQGEWPFRQSSEG